MNQLTKGLLTIGVPTYNGERNFVDLFNSIQNLGLQPHEYEIVIVDNFSNDDTEHTINRLMPEMPGLVYYRNSSNIGRIENWNRTLALMKGEYLIMMNVNDRFLKFDLKKHLEYLDRHPEIPMILTNIDFADHTYPDWQEYGILPLEAYLKKTFLDPEYLEFHSLGVLHQHIFRGKTIQDKNLQFDPQIPRTTDRVFVAEIVASGGGYFYYSNQSMVSWHLNSNRYHFSIHNNKVNFNFEELWHNEYQANIRMAELANIPLKDILQSQLILARFFMIIKFLRGIKNRLQRTKTQRPGMEVPTSAVFYYYLKTMTELHGLKINYTLIKTYALQRVWRWYLRSLHVYPKNKRSVGEIINKVELN